MPLLRGPVGIQSKKKAEAEAKKSEEAKKKEEAKQAEEVRQKALAEQKAKEDAAIKELMSTPEGRVKDFNKWLKSVPSLSQKCIKRIDREFADGVLVAEIISHYCPEICDPRHVFKWYSSTNKMSNWEYLNQKSFPELGFQLSKTEILNIIRPWDVDCRKSAGGCNQSRPIFEVLSKIRDGLAKLNPEVLNYRRKPDTAEEDATICEVPKKEPPKRIPRVDVYNNGPPFSKIEIQIARGELFGDDANNTKADSKQKNIDMNENCIEIHGTGGELIFDAMGCMLSHNRVVSS